MSIIIVSTQYFLDHVIFLSIIIINSHLNQQFQDNNDVDYFTNKLIEIIICR